LIQFHDALFIGGFIILIAVLIYVLYALIFFATVSGDSEDPFGNCYHHYFPYFELCKEMREHEQNQIKDIMDKACKYNQSWCVVRVPR